MHFASVFAATRLSVVWLLNNGQFNIFLFETQYKNCVCVCIVIQGNLTLTESLHYITTVQ